MTAHLVIERCIATQFYEGAAGRKSVKFVSREGEIVVSSDTVAFDKLPEDFIRVDLEVRGRVFQGEKGPVTLLNAERLEWKLAGADGKPAAK